MPDVLYVAEDGNVARRDSSCMRLCHQKDCEELLAKASRIARRHHVHLLLLLSHAARAHVRPLPQSSRSHSSCPRRCATAARRRRSAGEKLDDRAALLADASSRGGCTPKRTPSSRWRSLRACSGGTCSTCLPCAGLNSARTRCATSWCAISSNRSIFNETMRDACLAEYRLTNLPIR